MNANLKFSIIASSLALAAVTLPVTARADAVAQSILNITGFQFGAGDGTAAKAAAGSFQNNIQLLTVGATTTADATASLNGVADSGSVFGAIGRQAKVGAFGTYVPGAVLAGAPVATYVASTANQTGNALTSTATATTDALVSLAPKGDGTTQGNVNLNAEFTFKVTAANTKLEIAFDADAYLRTMLSEMGNGAPTSTAKFGWTIALLNNTTGDEVFSWTPNGNVGFVDGGIEYADGFNLTGTRSIVTPNDFSTVRTSKAFQAETNDLVKGNTYTISIRQDSFADAFLDVPEPGSLALLGVALVGAAGASRRRSIKK